MKTLKLTLKKKWFDMILCGEKKEEYREYKPYWITRLMNLGPEGVFMSYKNFDYVEFTNGYGRKRPSVKLELVGLYGGYGGFAKWGAAPGHQFILELGDIIETKNV